MQPPLSRGLEHTLALLKPDLVRAGKAPEFMQLIEFLGFKVVAKQHVQMTLQVARQFYAEHQGKPFYPKLLEFISKGPLWALVLSKENAVQDWRDAMGPTNSEAARAGYPTSLRALYGTDGTANALHGSDSLAAAQREVKLLFPALAANQLPSQAEVRRYLAEQLEPTLVKGLTSLAKQKPSSDRLEVLHFLGSWLLYNNPNKPQPLSPTQQVSLGLKHLDGDTDFDCQAHALQQALLAVGQ